MNGWHKIRQCQYREPRNDRYGRIRDCIANTRVAVAQRYHVVTVMSKHFSEPVQIMNAVVDSNTNCNRGNCDGHHIQWNSDQPH